MSDIKESYCSFDISKLIQDKGAKLKTINIKGDNHYYHIQSTTDKGKKELYDWRTLEVFANRLHVPTHALAIEWIRTSHNIWISVDFYSAGWSYIITWLDSDCRQVKGDYDSPQAATEAALLYTLKELIK